MSRAGTFPGRQGVLITGHSALARGGRPDFTRRPENWTREALSGASRHPRVLNTGHRADRQGAKSGRAPRGPELRATP